MDLISIETDVEQYCPACKLGQTSRWLAKKENQKEKSASTIVLAFTGDVSITQLGGRTIRVENRACNLTQFVEFGHHTQCTHCQCFGHPKELSTAKPICAVCAGKHTTENHVCNKELCKGGYQCTLNGLLCANCTGAHRSSNRNCPERVKNSQEFR